MTVAGELLRVTLLWLKNSDLALPEGSIATRSGVKVMKVGEGARADQRAPPRPLTPNQVGAFFAKLSTRLIAPHQN